jgi:uncharacterized delta-60 repeat protein
MNYRMLFIVILLTFAFRQVMGQRAGDLDRSFNYGRGENYQFNYGYGAAGEVYSTVIQSDGKILIGGNFTYYNGLERNRIARLNADGSLDNSFNPAVGASGTVSSITTQQDGKILIGGAFTTYNGNVRNRIARLNVDGSLDNSFNIGIGANDHVYSIALQSDGKILIGGGFTFFNGIARNRIARLNINGSLDTSFNSDDGANSDVNTIALQTDGMILIGGAFTTYNGTVKNRITRLNTDGRLDSVFNIGAGASSTILSLVLQSNGKILIGGFFDTYNGTAINRIARLNTDGSLDSSLNPGTGANNIVQSITLQSDDKIWIGGNFNSYNGTSSNYLARINTGGSIDYSYNPETGANSNLLSLALQGDGRIFIMGWFTSYNRIARNHVARLNSDGDLDSSFNPGTGANSGVNSIALQSPNKIIIGGQFTSYNGTAQNRIARLNSDGSLDRSFNSGIGTNSPVNLIKLQTDGKILIAGFFTSYNGIARNRIARLNPDGSLDDSFNPVTGANSCVNSLALQTDGKILIVGWFTAYNGTARNRIARLNMDGTLDSSFNPGTGANDYVYSIALQSDGKILIGGYFTSYNGSARNRIARLNTDGSVDVSFNSATGANGYVYTIAVQSDGKMLIGGDFTNYNGTARNRIARLNTDGSIDNSCNFGTGANSIIRSIALQSNGNILIGGDFSTFNNNTVYGVCRLLGSTDTTSTSFRYNKPALAIYPNPASSQFTIEVSNTTQVQVINALGQVLISQAVDNGKNVINTQSLPSGMYTVLAGGYKAQSLMLRR